MSYYGGMYGRGDYYTGRGDLGGFLRRVGRGAVGFLTGGVPGAVAGFAGGGGGPSSTRINIQPPQIGGVKLGPSFQVERYQGARGSVDFPASSDGACPRGFHLNKADGPKGPKGSYCVRNRSMNPANPRALRRAIRREEGFVALAGRFGMVRRRGAPKPLKSSRRKR